MAELTTGVEALDGLLEGVRIGDNLVVQAADAGPRELVAQAFVRAAGGSGIPVVQVVVGDRPAPAGGLAAERHVVQWTSQSAPETAATARTQLEQLDREVGPGAVFLFDSLTAVMELWGEAAALELFLWACPRLYRRESLAMWLVDPDRHRPGFLSRLQEITQVVIDLEAGEPGEVVAEVAVARGRPADVVGRRVGMEVRDDVLKEVGPVTSGRERLGDLVRTHRVDRGLAQAELARRVGISPSALSQVERGVRGVSGERLMRLWEALDVPFGPQDPSVRGYRVARRGASSSSLSQPGLEGRRVVADRTMGELWRVVVAPGAAGTTAVFETKSPEVVLVLDGVLDLRIDGQVETLQEGDALIATTSLPTGWANPSSSPTDVLWMLRGDMLHVNPDE